MFKFTLKCWGGVDKNLLAPPGGVDKNLLAPQGGVDGNLLAHPGGVNKKLFVANGPADGISKGAECGGFKLIHQWYGVVG